MKIFYTEGLTADGSHETRFHMTEDLAREHAAQPPALGDHGQEIGRLEVKQLHVDMNRAGIVRLLNAFAGT